MRKKVLPLLLSGCLLLGAGCAPAASQPAPSDPSPAEPSTPAWEPQVVGTFEPETGTMVGNVRAEGTFVTGFTADGDRCDLPITVEEGGFYDLRFTLRSSGFKHNYALVDGQRVAELPSGLESGFKPTFLRRIYLSAGEHTVSLEKYWGYADWEKLTILTSEPFDESVFANVCDRLCNPNATDDAKRLMSYLCDIYGRQMLSGQYCDSGINGWENMQIANNNGGRYPAVLGLDMGYYSQTGVDHGVAIKTTEQAIAYHEQGGIVTICWHWLAPEKYITGTWYSAFRPEEVRMDLTAIMDGRNEEGLALLKKDIGNIARELQKMQEAGVPVLWRPLHEASGGWFWWGAHGAETYKKLYLMLYDMLTNEYGLNNLIWVWNGQDPEWYPGDEYVDIVGTDIYAGEHAYSSQIDMFMQNLAVTNGRKLVVLSENGTLIDPDLAVRDRAMWGFFCTWSGEFVLKENSIRKTYSEQYTEISMLKKVYNSDAVITRDELPDLSTYPIRGDPT